MTTKDKIIQLIKENQQQSVKDLANTLDISPSMVHRHLKTLLDKNILRKIGRAPKVFYTIAEQTNPINNNFHISANITEVIDDNFLFITPDGKKTPGINGFIQWCLKRNFDPTKKAIEYVEMYNKYTSLKHSGLISGQQKLQSTFQNNTCLNDVFYVDFYAWEIFGKTKLGQLLLYSKQNQNKKLIKEVTSIIKTSLLDLLKEKNITAVGFIPPTIKRELQFMKAFEEFLNLQLPTIKIEKIKTEIITPQKTLNKLPDRIENANNTMVVTEKKFYKNILLIDDAIGSGATLNQVACKIKNKQLAEKIYGFAITGSMKGFDVISEI